MKTNIGLRGVTQLCVVWFAIECDSEFINFRSLGDKTRTYFYLLRQNEAKQKYRQNGANTPTATHWLEVYLSSCVIEYILHLHAASTLLEQEWAEWWTEENVAIAQCSFKYESNQKRKTASEKKNNTKCKTGRWCVSKWNLFINVCNIYRQSQHSQRFRSNEWRKREKKMWRKSSRRN